jgi:hypothetical protein
MNNKGISDFVAQQMDKILGSEEHKSLYGSTYKTASEKCMKCHEDKGECSCDDSSADDSSSSDENSAEDIYTTAYVKAAVTDLQRANMQNLASKLMAASKAPKSQEALKAVVNSFPEAAKQLKGVHLLMKYLGYFGSEDKDKTNKDLSHAEDEMSSEASLETAVDSLLTASAALDEIGFTKGAALSLKLASLVVESAKKKKEDKKKKMSNKEKMKMLRDKKDKKSGKSDSKSSKSSSSSSSSSSNSSSAKSKK